MVLLGWGHLGSSLHTKPAPFWAVRKLCSYPVGQLPLKDKTWRRGEQCQAAPAMSCACNWWSSGGANWLCYHTFSL